MARHVYAYIEKVMHDTVTSRCQAEKKL